MVRNELTRTAPVLVTALLATSGPAQVTPSPSRLLVDAAPALQVGSEPAEFTTVGGWTYFRASGPSGVELYRTAGDPRSTSLVFDFNPGPASSSPTGLVAAGAYLFFNATDGTGFGLHSTDGTLANTHRYTGTYLGRVGDVVLFKTQFSLPNATRVLAADPTTGQARVLVDYGPRLGTLAYVAGEPDGPNPKAYVTYTEAAQLEELWELDGTPAGSRLVASRSTPSLSIPIPGVTGAVLPADRVLYVTLDVASSVVHSLRAVDLRNGTATVLETSPTPRRIDSLTRFGSRAIAPLSNSGDDVAVLTDGTPSGTRTLTVAGAPATSARVLGEVADSLLVTRDTALLRLDAGANQLVTAGTLPAPPLGDAVLVQDAIYVSDLTDTLLEIRPDGTATRVFAGPRAVTGGRRFGRVAFRGDDGGGDGTQPWLFDPASRVSQQVARIPNLRPVDSNPEQFTRYGDEVAFAATDDDRTTRVWLSSGTAASTREVPTPGPLNGPARLVEVASELWIFSQPNSFSPVDVHVTDGRTTRLLASLTGTLFTDPVAFRDGVLLSALIGGVRGLHRIAGDGTLTRLVPESGAVLVAGELAYYATSSTAPTAQLFVSDGTMAGTRSIGTFGTSNQVDEIVAFDDRIWIRTGDATFAYDGATLRQVGPRLGQFLATDERLFGFDGFTSLVVYERGSTTPTHFSTGGLATLMTTLGDRLIYARPPEIRITDGTVAGTDVLLGGVFRVDFRANGLRLDPDRALLFGVEQSPTSGPAIYVTDGTAAGTHRIEDATIGQRGSFPRRVAAAVQGRVYFARDDATVGIEPFVLDPGAVAGPVGTDCTSSSTRTLELTANRAPVLGATVTLTGRGTGSTTAALLLGPPAFRTTRFPGSTCPLHVERFGLTAISPIPLDAAGSFRIPLTLPNDPGILGIRACFQALFDVPGMPSSLDASPGLLLQPGR